MRLNVKVLVLVILMNQIENQRKGLNQTQGCSQRDPLSSDSWIESDQDFCTWTNMCRGSGIRDENVELCKTYRHSMFVFYCSILAVTDDSHRVPLWI